MGLDAIEIVMGAEERFNVSLDDSECANLRTVAELAALVIAKLTVPGETCPSQRAFYELRRVLGTVGVRRERIRPRSLVDDLLPALSGRTWRRLCAADRRLTTLTTGDHVESGSALLWLLGIVVGASLLSLLIGGCLAILLAVAATGTCLAVHHALGNFRRVRLQPAFATIGDLARALAPPTPLTSAGERLAREGEVLDEVRRITARCLDIPLERVQARSNFVRDLGMD